MIRYTPGLVIAALLAGCVAAPSDEAGGPADVFAAIVGRPLVEVDGRGTLTLAPDGTGLGTLDGQPVTVSWVREGELFCRSGFRGVVPVMYECQTVDIAQGVATFRNADGIVSNRYRLG
ncbi:MAG: hypothetical protein AAF366_09975 [Pseudomonadota bacterium]